jgi:hypothetical protein
MRIHPFLVIATGTMIMLSAFVVLQAHHKDKGAVGSPYVGLTSIQCSNPLDNDLIPAEQTCEKPSRK